MKVNFDAGLLDTCLRGVERTQVLTAFHISEEEYFRHWKEAIRLKNKLDMKQVKTRCSKRKEKYQRAMQERAKLNIGKTWSQMSREQQYNALIKDAKEREN